MRVKIIMLNVICYIYSLLYMLFKGKYALVNRPWWSISYSICALLLALMLIVIYERNRLLWASKNKKEETRYIAISGACLVSLILAGIGRW